MRVSVGICTWNRARLLEQTLACLERLRIPAGVDWTVVVVNNASNDDTDAVLGRHQDRLPLRCLHEPRAGKSHALNAAVAALDSELTLWTDDDVQMEPDWLEAYVKAARCHPQAAFFGGPISPWFEARPPDWMLRTFSMIGFLYGALDLGPVEIPLGGRNLPFGANFAIRTAIQKNFAYDIRLGRNHGNLLVAEETDLCERLLKGGHQGLWVPEARVRHWVPAARLSADYVRRAFVGLGQTAALTGGASRRRFSRVRALIDDAKFHFYRWIGYESGWVRVLLRSSFQRGVLSPPSNSQAA